MNNIEIIIIIIIIGIIIFDRLKKKKLDSEDLYLSEEKSNFKSLNFLKTNKVLIVSLALILSFSFYYYYDFNKTFDEVKALIENEDYVEGRLVINKLNNKLIKIKNLDNLNKEFNYEEAYNKLNNLGNSSVYKEFYFTTSNFLEENDYYDTILSIYNTISNFKLDDKDSLRFKNYDKLIVRKQLLEIVGITNLFMGGGYINNLSEFPNSINDSNQQLDSLGSNLVSEYKRLRPLLEERRSIWDNATTTRIQSIDFLFDPSYQNVIKILSQNISLKEDGTFPIDDFFNDKDTQDSNFRKLGFITSRYQFYFNLNKDKRVSDLIINLIEKYIYCYSCKEISWNSPIDMYLNSYGLKAFSFSSDYDDLKSYEVNKLVKELNIILETKEKYVSQIPRILKIFSAFFKEKRPFEQIKLTNRLESIFPITDIEKLSGYNKELIAGIYTDNIEIMWDKEDFRGGVKSTEKLIKIKGYENLTQNQPGLFSMGAADAYRNLWAMNFNIKPIGDKNNICDYLFKASQLSPEDYYDSYLKECN